MAIIERPVIKYDIVYIPYQQIWVVFRTDYTHLSLRSIYRAETRKECQEWLKEYRSKNENYKN